jgi:hypothetical protein
VRSERRKHSKIKKNKKKRTAKSKSLREDWNKKEILRRQNKRKMKDVLSKKWTRDMAESHSRSVLGMEDRLAGINKMIELANINAKKTDLEEKDETTEGNELQSP